MSGGAAAILLIIIFTSFFACIFGIYYLNTRLNLAMVEKGMNPKFRIPRPAPYLSLKIGLLLCGAGMGLFIAYLIDSIIFPAYKPENIPVLYFALLAIGGGAGLYLSYRIESTWWEKNKKEIFEELKMMQKKAE